jgi:hypothetical protein
MSRNELPAVSQVVSPYAKLCAASLVGIALSLLVLIAAVLKYVVIPHVVIIAVCLITAGLLLTNWRPAPIVAIVVGAFTTLSSALGIPRLFTQFLDPLSGITIATTTLALSILISAIAATRFNYSFTDRPAPSSLSGVQSMILGIGAAGIIVTLILVYLGY